jgi:tripartite-type tricarboxylate transporter receptor subunit TctC
MLAVMSANRAPAFPDVPTMRDLGYPNFVVETWYGIFAPAGTPVLITTKLSAELNSILQEPEVRAQLERQGMIPVGGPPEHLGTFVQEDLARWKRVVTETGLKPE